MRWFFISLIKVYWYLIPQEKRRSCIFSKSCSNYVMDTLKYEGALSGLRAFSFRYNNCRKGYKIISKGDEFIFLTVKNNRVKKEDVKPSIIDAYYDTYKLLSKPATDNNPPIKHP
jgi:putative component of membrane protein insertase Oxa1/YidC/SpoIIIJ protein YidD